VLEKALEDARLETRCAVTRTLGRLGAEAKRAVPALARGLKHEEAALREASAKALGEIGPATKEAREALLRVSKEDEDEDVRRAAAEALTKIQGK
jgi:HEAT repeat protein